MNESRQPTVIASQAINGPVAAAPRVRPLLVMPVGRAQPAAGNQLRIEPAMTGKRGAWTRPIRTRRAIRLVSTMVVPPTAAPGARPVARLTTAQPTAIQVSTRRAPQEVAQNATRELSQRIRPGERGEHHAELHLREPQVAHHALARHRHVRPQHVGDEGERHQDREDPPAYAAGRGAFGNRRVVHAREQRAYNSGAHPTARTGAVSTTWRRAGLCSGSWFRCLASASRLARLCTGRKSSTNGNAACIPRVSGS